MLTLRITIEGHEPGDLEFALEEVSEKVKWGYTSGQDSNKTGNYSFEIAGAGVQRHYVPAPEGDGKE